MSADRSSNNRSSARAGLEDAVAGFRKLLDRRGHNWEFNQLHGYFSYDRRLNLARIRSYWDQFISKRTGRHIFDLYVHIPFCNSRCNYCMYKTWAHKDPKRVENYIDFLIEEIRFFKGTFHDVAFERLLIGGGTPNILTSKQFKRLFGPLFNDFSFTGDATKTIECNPEITTAAQLRLFKRAGFNKINFGVQSLNPACLRTSKRAYQTGGQVNKAIQSAKKAGFRYISVDMILGLPGDTWNGFSKTFAQLARFKPANIIVYGLKPPSAGYLSGLLGMSQREYYRDHYPKLVLRAVRIMRTLAQRHGYNHDTLDPAKWQWGFCHKDYSDLPRDRVYTGELTGCNSILGLGIYSHSHIWGLLDYRQTKQPQRFSSVEKIGEGRVLEKKEEMVKFILNHLDRNSNIPRPEFKRLFHKEIIDVFPYALLALRLLGIIRRVSNDLICFSFSKLEDKYIYTLFFFREAGFV